MQHTVSRMHRRISLMKGLHAVGEELLHAFDSQLTTSHALVQIPIHVKDGQQGRQCRSVGSPNTDRNAKGGGVPGVYGGVRRPAMSHVPSHSLHRMLADDAETTPVPNLPA